MSPASSSPPPSFADIRQKLGQALCQCLLDEARHRSLAPDPDLYTRAARELDAWISHPHSAGDSPCHPELLSHFGALPPLALLAFETPSIQAYLFKTRRPIDLRGGSVLIDDFSLEHAPALAGAGLIYSGAGSGLLFTSAGNADPLAATLSRRLADNTDNDLEPVTASLPIWPRDLGGDRPEFPAALAFLAVGHQSTSPPEPASRYAATCATLAARLRRARGAFPLPPILASHELGHRCDACGERPGRPRPDERDAICSACLGRRTAARRQRSGRKEPFSFEELVENEKNHQMALLYADGANAGALFDRLDGPARHRALSLAIDHALATAEDALLAGLDEKPEDPPRSIRALRGGDDLMLVLPAAPSFTLAALLIETFEKTFDQHLAEDEAFAASCPARLQKSLRGFGLGVGLVIADAHFPISFLVRYAGELLRSAKRRIADGERSALDFAVLRSGTPLADSIELWRRSFWREEGEGPRQERLDPTCRPYGGSELQLFLERARAFGALPPAQVYALARELRRGRARSRNFWRYQHSRSGPWQRYAEALEKLGIDDIDHELWQKIPGSEDPRTFRSRYPDLIETFPFFRATTENPEAAAE